jgi:hypothetical protein
MTTRFPLWNFLVRSTRRIGVGRRGMQGSGCPAIKEDGDGE